MNFRLTQKPKRINNTRNESLKILFVLFIMCPSLSVRLYGRILFVTLKMLPHKEIIGHLTNNLTSLPSIKYYLQLIHLAEKVPL